MRAGEVAGLGLDDINWRRGEITIRGKRNRLDALPLPADVGEAVAGYLRDGRPATALDRNVFTRVRAPAASPTEVPPASLLPGGPRRAVPYLYSPADITALLAQADRLKTPLRRAIIKTLIGLMAVTGMRGGEVVALDDEDFDTSRGLLLVRHAKLARHAGLSARSGNRRPRPP